MAYFAKSKKLLIFILMYFPTVKLISRHFLIGGFLLLLGHISKAQIATNNSNKPTEAGKDTLYINVDNNEKIGIKRTIMENTKKKVGKRVFEFRSYKIEFKNTKNVSLKMKVQDLIPSSLDNEIDVEILESSDAEIDFTRGKLSWNFRLKPKEKKILEVKYNVNYPKNRIILGIENVLQLQTNIRKTL